MCKELPDSATKGKPEFPMDPFLTPLALALIVVLLRVDPPRTI